MRLEIGRQARLPTAASLKIDLIHCNHFFSMPAAISLRERTACPILLETHDLQARQYALSNHVRVRLPPLSGLDEMLAIELDAMRAADFLIHLNDEEFSTFQGLLPSHRHTLLYPAVAAVPPGQGGGDLLIVASANYPNFAGVRWFLEEVWPHARDLPVRILGNVDREIRSRARPLYREHRDRFTGRVDANELNNAYRNASAVLLPATAGHGISIKTIEAFSCGAPLVATPLAFRGLGVDARALPNVEVAEDALSFARAMEHIYKNPRLGERRESATRRLFEERFAMDAYKVALWAVAKQALATSI